MTTFIIICIASITIALIVIVFLIKDHIRMAKESKTYKLQLDNLRNARNKVEESIAKTNKEKNSLNTGDDVNDLANGLKLMQKYSSKK